MGLGKTVQTLGLILYNPPSRPSDPICNVIVCPNRTIIDSWMNEIEKFCKPGTFRIKMYLPENNKTERSKIVDEINNNQVDIAFSTYSFLEAEYRRGDEKGRRTKKMIPHAEDIHRLVLGKKKLFESIDWCSEIFKAFTPENDPFSITISDEAHHIRNRETGRFKAMMFLAERSKHCLALTGTPFVNGPTDIHSLLAFIGMEPLNDHVYFETAIDKPVRAMKRQGLETLRKNLGPVILRRTKNVLPNIELFAKEVKTCKVPFANDEHKETYETLYKVVRAVLDGLVNGHQDENTVPLDIISKFQFTMAQKLSRCCATGAFADYPQLCCAREILKKIQRDKTIKKLSAVEALDILQQLHLANQGENGDVLNDEAIARTLSMPQPPKIKYLLQLMEREMCPEEKGLIFSQWSSYLKIVEKEISEAGHKVARIGGDVPVEQRVEALRFFNSKSKDSPRFLLCPLKAGEGLNLQAANVVFFLDLWWNRASEMQAEDRSHRLGQNKVVRCHHVMMKSSIEERMMNLQKAKEMVGKGTIKALTTKEEKLAKTKNYLMDLYQLKPRDDVESNQHWE